MYKRQQHTKEEAVGGVTSGLIGKNETVTWRAKHLGVYQKLTVRITEYERPYYFVDEMEEGVFKRFKHEHLFRSEGSLTFVKDRFDYTSPFGLLGKIADYLFLEYYMRRFLIIRNDVIKDYAESGKWRDVLS